MRKIALLTTALLVLGLFSLSADPGQVEFTVSGSSTMTLGYDIQDKALGWENASTADLKVVFVPSDSVTQGANGDDVWAYIALNDFKYEVTAAGGVPTAPSVTTKLHLGNLSITTFSAPTISVDYVAADDGGSTAVSFAGSGGFAWQYDNFVIDGWTIAGAILSDKSYTGDDKNTDNGFAIEVRNKFSLANDGFVEFKGARHLVGGAFVGPIGFGGSADFGVGGVKANVKFDTEIAEDVQSANWDLGTDFTYAIGGSSSLAASLTTHIPGGAADPTVNSKVTLTKTAVADGDEDWDPVGAALEVKLNDLTGAGTWELSLDLNYLSNGVKPFVEIDLTSGGDVMPLTIGVEITRIDNLTSTIKYSSTDLAGADQEPGVITWENKISYS